jgi:squalene-hopene/tetraprenyl-beta-curcumene cyclase
MRSTRRRPIAVARDEVVRTRRDRHASNMNHKERYGLPQLLDARSGAGEAEAFAYGRGSKAIRVTRRSLQIVSPILAMAVGLALALAAKASAPPAEQAPIDWQLFRSLWLKDLPRATSDEPLLGAYSEQKAVAFLDDVALKWARQDRCGTCHTTVAYLMARPLIGDPAGRAAWTEVREAAAGFASGEAANRTGISTIIVAATATALALGDTAIGRPMQPDTRALFDYLWASQEQNGSWVVRAEGLLPFLERDPRYLALLVALAVGYAPGHYYEDPAARAGFARLKEFLRRNPPINMHEKSVLLWASVRTPGLLTTAEQAEYTRSLLALQNPDGGWVLPSMGRWPRHDGAPNDPRGASDGYATSLATLVLCERGFGVDSVPVRRGVAWIKRNQRVSGRWYTRSLFSDGFQNYLSIMGSAYAVMALHRCGAAS